MDAAPPSGAAGATRPTVWRRPLVAPEPWEDALNVIGYPVQHPYVRRFWTAAIGPGAVADLLRMAAAARSGTRLRRPVHLPALLSEGLVRARGNRLLVRPTIPPLPARHAQRLPPALREEHGQSRWDAPHRPS